ncbi:hypothetical protein SYNTR_0002 [Candidatus Syntrophocurvum alkaliphilum]|uniref:Clostripain n=1 Tax=Candidatus Syntrophocurvum alkaliphilum TaxID=2293317 RepID=A0A6I6DAU5_9FIRM|nr:clostripain-related cysteine peptidase [Candidatus Syntrophocurvum alkaliphilum]QGT98595.1 hypothetical protein SYNTR_0002 [Candidatus Syntrophocurvum alkaliphilum]
MHNINKTKEWTVLLYASAINELEPYILKELSLIKNTVNSDKINVICQISRTSPEENSHNNKIKVITQRYIIKNNNIYLIEDLGGKNMAEPKTLFEFLLWATERFSSNSIMLAISGHSAGFVGLIQTKTENGKNFMGINGFAKALRLFQELSNKKIDILVFDTCFMNMIEIWYEIIVTSNGTVKYAILPLDNSPLYGLPLYLIINNLNKNHLIDTLKFIVSSINSRYPIQSHVFAITLDADYFIKLRILIDKIADFLIKENVILKNSLEKYQASNIINDCINLLYLLDKIVCIYPNLSENCLSISFLINQIVICPSLNSIKDDPNLGLKLFLPNTPEVFNKFSNIYQSLSFSYYNNWLNLIEINNS